MSAHNEAAKHTRSPLPDIASEQNIGPLIGGVNKTFVIGDTVPTDTSANYERGCIFINKSDSTMHRNEGTRASSTFVQAEGAGLETDLALTTTGNGSSKIGVFDTNSNMTGTTVETILNEHAVHQQTAQAMLFVPLFTFRETSSFDVGNIAVNGGILASDTTPVLDAINAATDGCQRFLWASSNNDQVVTQIGLPPDLDTSAVIVVHFRIVSGSTTDAVGFTLASFFNEGDSSVADTSGTNQTATYAEVTATIAAADIPSGAQTLSLGLTPVNHTTDTMAMSACWIEYTRLLLTS